MSWVVSMENRSFVFRWNRGEEGVSRAEREDRRDKGENRRV